MNWPALMAHGLGTLHLSPAQFWSMTPREFVAASGALSAASPMDHAALDSLRAQYPDFTKS